MVAGMTSPLQEAIAKAQERLETHTRFYDRAGHPCRTCGHEWPCREREAWQSVLDSLGVLRASDDTRYVAMSRERRDWLSQAVDLLREYGHANTAARVEDVVAAYDAVAPNAKDHA